MTLIVPRAPEPVHRFIAAPAKAMPAPAPSAFADYLGDPALSPMPERQSAWSFGELGVFGHRVRQGTDPATNAAGGSGAAPALKTVSDLPGTAKAISELLQSTAPEIMNVGLEIVSVAASSQTDLPVSNTSPLTDESATVVQTDLPEAEYEPLHQIADESQADHAERSHSRSFVQARGFTKNAGDIGLAVFGTGKFLQVNAFGDGLGVDARMRLRKMIDVALAHYGHTASDLYVNGALQDQPLDRSFTSIMQANILQGGTDGDHRG
jgi:hypothetical protein